MVTGVSTEGELHRAEAAATPMCRRPPLTPGAPNLDRHCTGSRAPPGRDGWIDDAATSRHLMTSPIDGLDPAGCELGSRSSTFSGRLAARLLWWPAHSTRPKITADPAAMIPNSASCAQPPRSPASDGSSTAVRRRDHRAVALVDGQGRGRLRRRRRRPAPRARAAASESATMARRTTRSTVDLVTIAPWLRSRSAWASRAGGPTGSTTSPSSRAGAPATPRTSTSPGRSTPSASSCRSWRSAMDGVVSPATAIEIGRLGGVGVLNLEGLWTRYEDPEPLLEEIAELDAEKATRRMQEIYQRADQARAGHRAHPRDPGRRRGVVRVASRRSAPSSCSPAIVAGRARPARHPGHGRVGRARVQDRRAAQPQAFIRELDIPVIVGGCASYQAALHLMRTGAAGVLVGVGPGPRLHHPRRARHRRAPGHRHRRRPGGPHAPPRRDRRLRATSSPTAAWPPAATSPRPSSAAPTR